MKLEIADLVEGSESPAGDGITGALRCVLVTSGGARRAAILKKGPIDQIAAESFCALLLKAWGLNVPDPFLVRLTADIGFASADVGYPNLKQSLGVGAIPHGPARAAAELIACKVAAEFRSTPIALAADEAIGNRDRNLGNILWDGRQEAWIDHAMCLDAGSDMADVNKLAIIVQQTDKVDAIARSAVAQALALDASAIVPADEAVQASLGHTGSAEFVARRIVQLATRIVDRFPVAGTLL